MSRNSYRFNRCDAHEFSAGERVGWLDRFADELAKKPTSVDVGRSRSYRSIVDQINSIVVNKPVHATVESVVKDMQERIGLNDYLTRVSKDNNNAKIAQIQDINSKLQKRIFDHVKYLLKKHNGLISLPAIQFELKSTFEKEVDDDYLNSEDISRAINNLIVDYQKRNPSKYVDDDNLDESMEHDMLSDDDGSNNDFFAALAPNVD